MTKNIELPLKQRVTFGKFQNIDMRVAKVISARMAEGIKNPSRLLKLDLGHLGEMTSVAQFALVDENDLVAKNVIVVANFAPREMGEYTSEVLVMGVPHPDSPDDQAQALPLMVDSRAIPGSIVF